MSVLESSSLHSMLVKMLRHVWGSNHTFQDHREPVNICLLCRGTQLWFGLASKLICEYARREREDSMGKGPLYSAHQPLYSEQDHCSPSVFIILFTFNVCCLPSLFVVFLHCLFVCLCGQLMTVVRM